MEKRMFSRSILLFVKATLIGGIVFLLPIVVAIIVLAHALSLAEKAAKPAMALLPDALAGAVTVTAAAVAVLVLVSLLAGLFARTRAGSRVMAWFESSLVGGLPQYQLVKSMAEGMAQVENAKGVTPALIYVGDAWQLGYVLEGLGRGKDWVGAFLPQAPTPMSGNILYVPVERVRPLEMTMVQAMSIVKRLGVGSADALRGVDLTPPMGRGTQRLPFAGMI
jgi:uncharacterized membrane protein